MYMTGVYDASSGPGIRVPPPVVYLGGFLAGVVVELLVPSPQPAAWLRIAAGGLGLAILLALDTSAMVRFSRSGTSFNPARPATALVTDGPYRITRNPMYVGMAGLHAGAAVATGVLWALAFLPAVLIAIDRLVIPREERHLAATFGEEYERYRRRVRRWI
jgi:protein-S-isoprenylcysteine O-methyltransferase Ste14